MTGAVIGAVDAGARVAEEADKDNKTKSAGSTSKNKSSASNKKSATDKKTKTGK